MKTEDPPAGVAEGWTAPATVTSGPPGVLLVDDDSGVRRVVEAGLTAHGFVVWPAAGGREGVESYRLNRASIAVALLDVRMPGRDGPATLTDLQQIDPAILACFMTGFAGRYTDQHLFALGARAVFQKPLSLKGLAARLVELTAPMLLPGLRRSPSSDTSRAGHGPTLVRGDRLP